MDFVTVICFMNFVTAILPKSANFSAESANFSAESANFSAESAKFLAVPTNFEKF